MIISHSIGIRLHSHQLSFFNLWNEHTRDQWHWAKDVGFCGYCSCATRSVRSCVDMATHTEEGMRGVLGLTE